MKCEKCGKNTATSFFQQTINGKTTAYNLCAACAKEMGMQKLFSGDPMHMSNLFSDFLFPLSTAPTRSGHLCETCGKSLDRIMSDGKVGCADCYKTFENALIPSIEKLHGNAVHTGKVPRSAGEGLRRRKQLESLKTQLAEAIQKEDFESAAQLRDRIRDFEKEARNG